MSGHSSGIDSVSFDSSEVLVAAGAASGTIKLWDLEEAKIVRTLTGHRSNCISLDFHPFGEFFASGSLDTNLKIWDIRRKGCIHTYKGHTRGVNAIRFTPDGRWVVSGGEDNSVKLWDLTAGKLLHDFKCHDGQIHSIDFHPHEFLLATGSADKTVKFWDLETFELIGSAGSESTGVRSMTFSPDGKTLLCGLQDSLKVYSWEPIRCHDTVDVGWSKLSDLNIHEGKLLGCSHNQSCVGVWVVDISCIEPYAKGSSGWLNAQTDVKSNSSGSMLSEDMVKPSLGRLSISHNIEPAKDTGSSGRLSSLPSSDSSKESKPFRSAGSSPISTPQRGNLSSGPKAAPFNSTTFPNVTAMKKNAVNVQSITNPACFNSSDAIPVVVPRNNSRFQQSVESRNEGVVARTMPLSLHSKALDVRKFSNVKDELESTLALSHPEVEVPKATEITGISQRKLLYLEETSGANVSKDLRTTDGQKRGIARSLVSNWERKERPLRLHEGLASNNFPGTAHDGNITAISRHEYRDDLFSAEVTESASEEDVATRIMERHNQFASSMQSRLAKLQMIHNYWQRHDIRGALTAIERMADHGVIADVISLLIERTDLVTLDIFTCLLPLLNGLLGSETDRHQYLSLEMLLKLVRVFGSLIYSSLSAPSSVGVDIEAEKRLERCNLCYIELEKVKESLPALSRKGGSISKFAQELNFTLEEAS